MAAALASHVRYVVIADRDILRHQLLSAVQERRLFSSEKENDLATGLYLTCPDLRLTVMKALHPKPIKCHLCQIGLEVLLRRRNNFDIGGTDCRPIGQRIGKTENLAPSHFLLDTIASAAMQSTLGYFIGCADVSKCSVELIDLDQRKVRKLIALGCCSKAVRKANVRSRARVQ